jgi:hypothetical protein
LNPEAIARSRLRIDTRKWMLSKMLPKIYGDKVTVDSNVEMNPSAATAIQQMTDAELQEAVHKQMIALGMKPPDDVIDVEASQVKPSDVLDMNEINKSLGDFKESN